MITIREQHIDDAQRFFEILQNPNFLYFAVIPNSLEEEIEFLKMNDEKRKKGTHFNYSILSDGELIGAIGLTINRNRPYIGEAGYFVDEKFWGQGAAGMALKLLEDELVEKLKIKRIELLMDIRNIPSEKVAIKSGYQKEGTLRNVLKERSGEFADCYIYSKTF